MDSFSFLAHSTGEVFHIFASEKHGYEKSPCAKSFGYTRAWETSCSGSELLETIAEINPECMTEPYSLNYLILLDYISLGVANFREHSKESLLFLGIRCYSYYYLPCLLRSEGISGYK